MNLVFLIYLSLFSNHALNAKQAPPTNLSSDVKTTEPIINDTSAPQEPNKVEILDKNADTSQTESAATDSKVIPTAPSNNDSTVKEVTETEKTATNTDTDTTSEEDDSTNSEEDSTNSEEDSTTPEDTTTTNTSTAPTNTSTAPTNTSTAPTNTSTAPTNTSTAPTNTSTAPTNTSTAPTNTSTAPTNTSTAPTTTDKELTGTTTDGSTVKTNSLNDSNPTEGPTDSKFDLVDEKVNDEKTVEVTKTCFMGTTS